MVAASHATTGHGPTRANSRSRRCISTKPTGMTKSVSTVEVARPPITTVAKGGHTSFSRPVSMASGHSAAMVVADVISTGRVRSRTDARAAAPADQPPRTRCWMRSTSRMAGLTVRPSSSKAPAPAYTVNGVPVRSSVHTAPISVSGSASSTSSGSVRDSKAMPSTSSSRSTAGTASLRIIEVCSSASSSSTV